MNSQQLEQQERLQAAAERAERECLPAGDPQVDAYRLVWRALKQPLPLTLPADFAQQVVRRLQAREEAAGLERGLTNFLILVMAVAAAIFALPPLAGVMAQALRATAAQPVQWPLVFVAAFGLGAVWLMDFAMSARRR